jgi:hypothetical protein
MARHLVPLTLVPFLVLAPRFPAQEAPALVADAQHAVAITRGATVQTLRIESRILEETRPIHVVLPASFRESAPERRYPVAIVLDGEDNVPSVAAVASELARNGQIPELVIVAIPNLEGATWEESAEKRVHDLTPPGLSVSGSGLDGGGDRFLDFIEQELLPAVERQFRGAAPRVFVGHSSGGILATWVAATRPAFRAVIAIDTPTEFGDDWLTEKLIARAGTATSPLRYATFEARFGWRDDTWQALVAAAPASWRLHRDELEHESHESLGLLAMYLGLREVFGDYSMLAAPVAPTTSILPYYDGVGASLGAVVLPPRKLLRNVVEDLLMEGRGATARAAYGVLATGYGAPSDGAALLARIGEAERRPPPKETVEGLLATPFPSPAEAKAFLGEWVGDAWMNEDEPRTGGERLVLEVVDGRLAGKTVNRLPSGKDLVMPWTYLQITPAGMTWGYMNGMRPRGMLLFEGTLAGDTLTGQMRLGGVDFRRPDGSPPPVIHFSFRRSSG